MAKESKHLRRHTWEQPYRASGEDGDDADDDDADADDDSLLKPCSSPNSHQPSSQNNSSP